MASNESLVQVYTLEREPSWYRFANACGRYLTLRTLHANILEALLTYVVRIVSQRHRSSSGDCSKILSWTVIKHLVMGG
jgi:hypothetical protein